MPTLEWSTYMGTAQIGSSNLMVASIIAYVGRKTSTVQPCPSSRTVRCTSSVPIHRGQPA